MKMLDRNRRYGTVYGDPVACFYQDGTFFDGQGRPVGEAEKAEAVAPAEEPPRAVDQDDSKAKRIAELNSLHISKVRKLSLQVAEQLGVNAPKQTGAGVKAKLIKWIADHTTD